MRLDKFLKVSRIIKRRVIAKEASDSGKITINGKVAKAASKVFVGDIIEIGLSSVSRKYRVLSLDEKVKKEDSTTLYELI